MKCIICKDKVDIRFDIQVGEKSFMCDDCWHDYIDIVRWAEGEASDDHESLLSEKEIKKIILSLFEKIVK